MRTAIIYNLIQKPSSDEPEDMYAEFDDMEVPTAIKSAMEKHNLSVDLVEFNPDLLTTLSNNKYDFVFNIAEGLHGESRESHVPAVLEMLRINYLGNGVLTNSIALDKGTTKKILQYHGVPTPKFQIVYSMSDEINVDLRFPLVVKPNAEGSGKGMTSKSLVKNKTDLKRMIKFLIETYHESVLIEEFLPGREFTVAVLGNKKKYVLPIIEIFTNDYPDKSGIYHYANKYKSDNKFAKAELDPELRKKILDIVLNTYDALNCKDLSRIDLRCNAQGNPEIIEINSIPGLNPIPEYGSYFPWTAFYANFKYDDLITLILHFAFERYNMTDALDTKRVKHLLKKLSLVNAEHQKEIQNCGKIGVGGTTLVPAINTVQ